MAKSGYSDVRKWESCKLLLAKKNEQKKDPKGKWPKMGKYLPKNARKKQGNSHNPTDRRVSTFLGGV